ncbi:hypothetical protein GCM10017586_00210 [Microbacterium imperiale]|uniref:Uncharacterized protein n=1 Tax=Microbacterium imperiale TaxID=33884 RepID=A0A9W6HE18_9MICO|nr:hypothetical protein GCM10017544_16430 [Microbacterium imperiale]GLJ78339.1 hypothetical protein GCM10017586_00210 [Microbacterium imperiale]
MAMITECTPVAIVVKRPSAWAYVSPAPPSPVPPVDPGSLWPPHPLIVNTNPTASAVIVIRVVDLICHVR